MHISGWLQSEPDRFGLSEKQGVFEVKSFLGLAIFAVLLFTSAARSADLKRQSYPLPVDVDDAQLRSSLYLQVEVKTYDMPLEKFAAQQLDSREAVFSQVLLAIRKKDYATFAKLWEPPKPAPKNADTKSAPAGAPNLPPDQVAELISQMMGGLQDVTVIAQALMGSESVFVWEAKMPKVSRRAAFSVHAMAGNKLTVTDVSSVLDPIGALLVSNMRAAARDRGYQPVADPNRPFRYAFPLGGNNTPGEFPVYLQFAGKSYNFSVYDEKATAPDPFLAFYQKVFLTFKKRAFDDYRAFYTPGSQRKLQQLFTALNKEGMENFYRATTMDRYVKFVLDADPVYLVFYSGSAAPQWGAGALAYDFVVKDPNSGKLMMTNFGYEGILDDVLRNRKLFDQQVLKPHPAAPPVGGKPGATAGR